jgi:hypothetical protein
MHIKRERPSLYDQEIEEDQRPARRSRIGDHQNDGAADEIMATSQQDQHPVLNQESHAGPYQFRHQPLSQMSAGYFKSESDPFVQQMNQQPVQDSIPLWQQNLSYPAHGLPIQDQPVLNGFCGPTYQTEPHFQGYCGTTHQQPVNQNHPRVYEQVEQNRVKMEETMTFPAGFGVEDNEWKVSLITSPPADPLPITKNPMTPLMTDKTKPDRGCELTVNHPLQAEEQYGNDFLPELPGNAPFGNGFLQTTGGYNVSTRSLEPRHFNGNDNQSFLYSNRVAVGQSLVPQMWPTFENQFQPANGCLQPSFDLGHSNLGVLGQPRLQGGFEHEHNFGLGQALPQSTWATNSQNFPNGLSNQASAFDPIPKREHSDPIIGSLNFASTGGMSEAFPAGTISPKALQINPSPATPTISYEQAYNAMLPVNEEQQLSSASSSEQLDALLTPTRKLNAKGRTALPQRPYSSSQSSSSSSSSDSNRRTEKQQTPRKSKKLSELRPKPAPSAVLEQSSLAEPELSPAKLHRQQQDERLLELRRAGMSYKDIKKEPGFEECAESTLRGRYRTLTVAPEDRVRKPIWKPRDVSSLFLF